MTQNLIFVSFHTEIIISFKPYAKFISVAKLLFLMDLMETSKRMTRLIQESIFEEIKGLVARGSPQNLGSGFTEWDTPKFLKDFLYKATMENDNQYGRSPGEKVLVEAIAKVYSPVLNRQLDPMTEILVTNGSTGALTNACCAFLEEGDEVVTLEPTFEAYLVQPLVYGAKIVTFAMEEPKPNSDKWIINFEEFEKVFNEKTRFLILNTPHNPTGKVLTKEETEKIVRDC